MLSWNGVTDRTTKITKLTTGTKPDTKEDSSVFFFVNLVFLGIFVVVVRSAVAVGIGIVVA